MKLSHLNGLRALEAILRTGTFTAAAEELGVTVAAVGHQIRGLEDYFGLKLFDRLPAGAKPTEQALSVAAGLTVGFAHLDDALANLAKGRDTGRLSIATSHFMLDDWLAERMPGFHRKYPGVEVSYDITDAYVDLFNSDVDMAIRFSPEPGPEYEYEVLLMDCFLPVCTPDFASRHDVHPEMKDLTGVPLYRVHDMTTDPAWVGWPELLARHSITKKDKAPVQHVAGYRVALAGEGLVLCGLSETFNDLRDGRLVAPLGPDFIVQYSYGFRLVWPAGRTMSRPMRNFLRWILLERDRFLGEASNLLGVELT
ncbi:LysR substrate-binding domain-containing protein [Solirhodobacter olei]|uniref:LysR substrate-binding domain-containing protein n=1 Tax=Solirhodobacter olei TaxID=2493082 RepID=UPI0013E2A846|nr:LysR substrate-binding domain-containing protein [Solirhodobacter olei]